MPRKESSTYKKMNVYPSVEKVMMRPVTYTGPIMSLPAAKPTIPPVPVQQKASFGEIIKEGFAFGIGSSIAQRIFGSSKQVIPQPTAAAIETGNTNPVSTNVKDMSDQLMYHQCILDGGIEETCKQYIV